MHNEFTSIIEKDNGWYIAYCPEIPDANGQGENRDRLQRESGRRNLPYFGGSAGGCPARCAR